MSADSPLEIHTLPLFPLHCVLFPQFPLKLHVFEERYRAMITRCIEDNAPFGVVLIREGEEVGAPAVPYEVGCLARILAVKRLEDGRMFLLAAGESRFRLLDYMEADLPYLIGRIQLVEDVPTESLTLPACAQETAALFQRYLVLLADRARLALPAVELPEDPQLLGFCIASVAQFPLPDKQLLLEMTDTQERLETEIAFLRALVAELEATPAPTPGGAAAVAVPVDPEAAHWLQYRQSSRN